MANLADLIEGFCSYRPHKDESPIASTSDLFDEFRDRKQTGERVSISTFANIVNCPYRVVNIGAGHQPRFNQATIGRMKKGSRAHKKAEKEIRESAEASTARGGPPDWSSAPPAIASIAAEDLLETPEVKVSLAVMGLDLRGKADGLLRTDGIVIAVERKPLSRMYHPASTLQAMSYAIGGCLLLKSEKASRSAQWLITDYAGQRRRVGDITEKVCALVRGFGEAYSDLVKIGINGDRVPDLRGPSARKCTRCEFRYACQFRIEEDPKDREKDGEPVWVKYAKPKAKKGGK
jgi:CRISPR/Cas system-associated exonuclease Cas4 (RecB family)